MKITLCTHARQLKAARMHTHKTARAYAHNSVKLLLTFLTNDSGTQRQINPKQLLRNQEPQNRQNIRGKLVALIKLVTTLWIPTNPLINSRNYWSPGSAPTPGQARFTPQHAIIQHHGKHHLNHARVWNPPPTRTSEPRISHRAEHLPQLMLSLRPLQPRVQNTWTPSPHRTPRRLRPTIRHKIRCAHKSWVHSSTCNTRPGSRRHLSPHTRTRLKYPRLENIHRYQQGLQAETSEPSAGSILPHTQEKIHSICRSNMPNFDNSTPQRIRETHQPGHRQNWQANEEPN